MTAFGPLVKTKKGNLGAHLIVRVAIGEAVPVAPRQVLERMALFVVVRSGE
jgi:hypothetical protein